MVKSIYFLKPAWCGIHLAGLWPEQGLQPVTRATALQAVVFTNRHHQSGPMFHVRSLGRLIFDPNLLHSGSDIRNRLEIFWFEPVLHAVMLVSRLSPRFLGKLAEIL
jgi:hypothetical protein